MRTFHYKRNPDFCPSINVDRLWSMVPEGVYEKAKTDSKMAPVIDVTKLVSRGHRFDGQFHLPVHHFVWIFNLLTNIFQTYHFIGLFQGPRQGKPSINSFSRESKVFQ